MTQLFQELSTYPDAGIFILRFMFGIIFLYHGTPKLFNATRRAGFVGLLQSQGFPVPAVFGLIVGVVECLGGLAVLLGVWVGPAALLIAMVMLVALWLKVCTWKKSFSGDGGYEFDLILLAVALALIFLGPGSWTF